MKTTPKLWFAALCGFAMAAFAAGAIAVLPSATLLENDNVKVSRALEKAHVKGSFHEHKVNRVMVYLQSGSQRFEYQDARQPAVFDWKAGQVVWSKPEGMHSPEVVSADGFNIVEIELKKPGEGKGAGRQNVLKVDAKHYKLEFENEQVRVLRVNLGAHQSTPLIEHAANSVAVFLTDEDARITDSKGVVATETHKAGDAIWQASATTKLQNNADKPLEIVLVELR